MAVLGSQIPTYNVNTNLIDPVTTQQFMDGALENVLQQDGLLSAMKSAGTITYDGYGQSDTKNVHVGLPSTSERGAGTVRTFSSNQQYVTAYIPWSNVEGNDMIRRLDAQLNSGPAAKVQLTKRILPNLAMGLRVGLVTRLLTQNAGSNAVAGFAAATSNPPPLGGLPTLFGYGSAAQNWNPVTRATTGVWTNTSKEVLPNTTYYGLATNPTSPPASITNPQTDCLSPVITAYNATAATWGSSGGAATWASNCREVLNHHIARQTRGDMPEDIPDLAIMTNTMFAALTNTFQAYYRVSLEKGEVDPNMRIGQGSTISIPYGPLTLKWSAYLSQEVCYVLNSRKMNLKLFPTKKLAIDPTLGVVETEDASMISVQTQYDIREDAHLISAGILGDFFLEPRYHGMSYAAS